MLGGTKKVRVYVLEAVHAVSTLMLILMNAHANMGRRVSPLTL